MKPKSDKIESAIVLEIMEHEIEINRLKDVLRLYQKPVSDTTESVLVPTKAGKRKYVRSGKYVKSEPFLFPKRKKLIGNLKQIKWKNLIIDTLRANGEPMTSKELVAELFSGKHKSTLKVIKRRLSVVLTLYKNDGILKTNKNGRGLKYGLPTMF